MADEWKTIGILELLETDERPVLVFDLTSTNTVPVFANKTLRTLKTSESNKYCLADATKAAPDPKHSSFLQWALHPDEFHPPASYYGIRWTAQTLRKRFRVIAGEGGREPRQTSDARTGVDHSQAGANGEDGKSVSSSLDSDLDAFRLRRRTTLSIFPDLCSSQSPRLDNSREPTSLGQNDITCGIQASLSDHVRFFLDFDWGSTSLGSISTWSNDLRRMVNFLFADPTAAALYVSESKICIYNEPYIAVTGSKHPGISKKTFLIVRLLC